ncbi:MAG TPA: DUF4388 domain-containing protein [Anaeromyxobacteraceae bacterium]
MNVGDKGAASALFNGMPEVTGVLTGDLGGNVFEATPRSPEERVRQASSTAIALRELASIGSALSMGRLELLVTHGARVATATALQEDSFLLATLDPARGTAPVEQALRDWKPAARPPIAPVVRRPTPPPIPAGPIPVALAASPTAAFSGHLSVFALPELLEFLRSGRRSGLLVCRSAAGSATLRFREGWVTAGRAPSTPALGQLLVRTSKISAKALEAPERLAGGESSEALGELLVREGLVDAVTVQRALAHQIEHAIRTLVGWQDGEFAFDSDNVKPVVVSALHVALDSQTILLNIFKELDEASRDATAGSNS